VVDRAAGSVLKEAADRVRAERVPVQTQMVTGDAGPVLVQQSETAALAVVGTRGRGGMAGRLGSVSALLAAQAHCPVAVIPCPWQQRPAGEVPAGSVPAPGPGAEVPMRYWNEPPAEVFAGRVVMGLDLFGADMTVLQAAAEAAQVHGRPLTLLTAASDVPDPDRLGVAMGRVLVGPVGQVRSRWPALPVSWEICAGQPADVLAGATQVADLMVLGCRGHSGVAGLLAGSVSQAVLCRSQCPVLVVASGRDGGR
jgi:nucleotide-binding universal stress UspA family protein